MMHSKLIRIGQILERRASAATSMIAGLSYSEVRLLSTLRGPGARGLTRAEIAQQCHLTPSAVSRALKPLEKSGYVTSQRDVRDARNSRAILTPSGGERLSHAINAVNGLWDDLDLTAQGVGEPMLDAILARLRPDDPIR